MTLKKLMYLSDVILLRAAITDVIEELKENF